MEVNKARLEEEVRAVDVEAIGELGCIQERKGEILTLGAHVQ